MPGAKERVAPTPSAPAKQPARDGSSGLSRDAVACPSFLRDMPPVDDAPQVTARARPIHSNYAGGAASGDARNSNLSIPFLQRKLAIGAVDDPLEREADRAADAVMSSGTLSSVRIASPVTTRGALQRKCACGGSSAGECEECRKKRELPPATTAKILRRATSATSGGITEAPSIVHTALRSAGRALDPSVRSAMEDSFGHDFGSVRVHPDSIAAQSVNAIAYTAGKDVVFAPGQYSPQTQRGQRLLAHELAHVVQQGNPRIIRRAPPVPMPLPVTVPVPGATDFQIKRVGRSNQAQVFFEMGSSTLTAGATSEINTFKASKPGSVELIGYSSADETAAVAVDRANAVKAALTSAPDAVTGTKADGNAAATENRSDFTQARSVEILPVGAPATVLDCKKKDKKGKLINPPKQPCTVMDPPTWTAFNAALKIATDAMATATASVAGAPSAGDAAVIDRFFGNHDPATLAALKTNLGKLETHVKNLPKITSCGGQCDAGGCAESGVIAYNLAVDAKSTMTLCVPTFKGMNVNDAARNLMHESAHGTSPLGGAPGKGTEDVAYRHERMLFQLSTADRLRNSDSYALFALFLREIQMTANPSAVPSGIGTPAKDTLTGFSATEEKAFKLALARLEKRLSWAKDWTGQVFGSVARIRSGGSTWAAEWGDFVMTEAAKRFPLTAPPAKPTLTDQVRLASILDRYRRMLAGVKEDLTATRIAAGVVKWASVPGKWLASAKLEVGPDFFLATADDQVSLLMEQVAAATKDVEAAYVPAYTSLAEWIHSQNP